jgi:hypothetical protein
MCHFACTIDWEKLVHLFSALLTPVIAITTATIAVQQYLLNRNQFRLALLDRRLKVFEATVELIATVIRTSRVDQADLNNFLIGTSERGFLFGSDVATYLDGIYDKAVEINAIGHPVPQGQAQQHQAAMTWFSGKTEETRKAFSKYVAFPE